MKLMRHGKAREAPRLLSARANKTKNKRPSLPDADARARRDGPIIIRIGISANPTSLSLPSLWQYSRAHPPPAGRPTLLFLPSSKKGDTHCITADDVSGRFKVTFSFDRLSLMKMREFSDEEN